MDERKIINTLAAFDLWNDLFQVSYIHPTMDLPQIFHRTFSGMLPNLPEDLASLLTLPQIIKFPRSLRAFRFPRFSLRLLMNCNDFPIFPDSFSL